MHTTRYRIDAIIALALIKVSSYLDRRAEKLANYLTMTEHGLQVCEEDWRSIYTKRWPEKVKEAADEPAF
jgi:hypothetical protein